MIEAVTNAFQIIQFQAETKKISLMLLVDQNQPNILKKILNDGRRFQQILLNFISNSLKFITQDGFIKVHLEVLEQQNMASKGK